MDEEERRSLLRKRLQPDNVSKTKGIIEKVKLCNEEKELCVQRVTAVL